ncbi:hypothetical protein [Actinomadura madurae]|uniref:hypothetical protein n=1 Tax=Actinomadura madurae TaxID=1993 RepID=UPI0020D1FB6F|nr:hypothetical protein [Actinomadura madurae]MCQ0021098.1 hypothetical protein [Actinomadura madurae]
MTAQQTAQLSDRVLGELVDALGGEYVLTSKTARMNRARVPAPFPVHRWRERIPDLVVMPPRPSRSPRWCGSRTRTGSPSCRGTAAPG